MFDALWKSPWGRAAAAAALIVAAAALFLMLDHVLVPLIFAFLLAYAFYPAARWCEERRIPRVVFALGLCLAGLAAILSVPFLLLPAMLHEAETLLENARKAHADEWTARILESGAVQRLLLEAGWISPDAEEVNVREAIAERIKEWIRGGALAFFQLHGQDLLEAGRTAGMSLAEGLRSLGRAIINAILLAGNIVLFLVVAIYLLNDFESVVQRIDELVPPRFRAKFRAIMGKIDRQMRGFIRGQAIVCLGLGTMYGIGFLIAGLPFAIPLAIFGGLASFVPYLGFALTILPATLLSVLNYGIDWRLAAVLATFAIAQAIESNLLTPKVMASQIGLGPIWVILAILVFSSTFGFVGLLVAVPAAAALKVLVVEAVEVYERSPLYRGDEPASSPGAGSPPEGGADGGA